MYLPTSSFAVQLMINWFTSLVGVWMPVLCGTNYYWSKWVQFGSDYDFEPSKVPTFAQSRSYGFWAYCIHALSSACTYISTRNRTQTCAYKWYIWKPNTLTQVPKLLLYIHVYSKPWHKFHLCTYKRYAPHRGLVQHCNYHATCILQLRRPCPSEVSQCHIFTSSRTYLITINDVKCQS